ncbi:MAG: hypothetical protein IKV16_03515 [Clostridia bacterium]|nr:hypothetical protein [Clostridia bacterium]
MSLLSVIEVKTDTVWHGATFIIDDREISCDSPEGKSAIFKITSEHQTLELDGSGEIVNKIFEHGSLDIGSSKINITLGYSAILTIENDSTNQREVILVDADGNVDPSTPLTQKFEFASRIYVKRTDDTPISVEGAIFIRLINQSQSTDPYERNILIERSNVTLSNITYEIKAEDDTLKYSAYSPFIKISNASSVSLSALSLTAQPYTKTADDMQSYAIGAFSSLNLTLFGCVESNQFTANGSSSEENSDMILLSYTRNVKINFCRFNSICVAEGVHSLNTDTSVIYKINYK